LLLDHETDEKDDGRTHAVASVFELLVAAFVVLALLSLGFILYFNLNPSPASEEGPQVLQEQVLETE
jgi:hypothetical protein